MKLTIAIGQVYLTPEDGDCWIDRLFGQRNFQCNVCSPLGAIQTAGKAIDATRSPVYNIEYNDRPGDISSEARKVIETTAYLRNLTLKSFQPPVLSSSFIFAT